MKADQLFDTIYSPTFVEAKELKAAGFSGKALKLELFYTIEEVFVQHGAAMNAAMVKKCEKLVETAVSYA